MSINLLPWRENLRRQRNRRLWLDTSLAVILLILSIVPGQLHYFSLLTQQQQQHNLLQQKLRLTSAAYAQALTKQQLQTTAMQQIAFLQQRQRLNQRLLTLLDKLSATMPLAIYLMAIEKHANTLHLQGKSPSMVLLATFLAAVEAQTQQRPSMIQTTKSDNSATAVDFNLVYTLFSL